MNSGIKSGATGVDVAQLQAALKLAGRAVDASDVANQTFGSWTLAALHAFQQQQELPVGDFVDDATAGALDLARAIDAGGKAPPEIEKAVRAGKW